MRVVKLLLDGVEVQGIDCRLLEELGEVVDASHVARMPRPRPLELPDLAIVGAGDTALRVRADLIERVGQLPVLRPVAVVPAGHGAFGEGRAIVRAAGALRQVPDQIGHVDLARDRHAEAARAAAAVKRARRARRRQ